MKKMDKTEFKKNESTLLSLFKSNKDFLKQLFSFGFSTSLSQLIMMVISILVARHLGPERFGVYSSHYALGSLTSIIFNLGLDIWILREGVGASDLRNKMGNVLKIKIVGGLVWSLFLILMSTVIRPDLYSTKSILIVAIDLWTDAAFLTCLVFFNLHRNIKKYSTYLVVSRFAKLSLFIFLIVLGVQDINLFMASRAFVSIAMLIIILYDVRPEITLKGGEKSILSEARPYSLSELLAIVYTQADVTLLNLLRGGREVGLYSPALNMITALFVIPNAFTTYTIPTLTKYYKQKNGEFVSTSKKLIIILSLIGVLLTIIVAIVSRSMSVFLLGDNYSLTGELLFRLSPLLLIKSIEFGFVLVIMSTGNQQRRIIPQLSVAIINIVLNIYFISKYGMVGAAVTYLISETVLLICYWFVASKILKTYKSEGS